MAETQGIGLLARVLSPIVGGENLQRGRDRREMENRMLRDSIAAQEEFVDLLGRTVEVPRDAPQMRQPQLWQDPAASQQGLPMSPVAGPGGFQTVPEISTPQGQQRVMQLMARMSPDGAMKVAEHVLPGSIERATAAMKEMQMFGYPLTQQGFQQYNADRGGGQNGIADLVALSLIQQREQQTAADAATAERETEERTREDRAYRNNLQVSGDSLMELAKVNERLMGREGIEGILSRPGLGFDAIRRQVAGAYDEDVAADIDSFNSLTNQIAISRLDTEGFDGNTNARFQAFTSTKPSFQAVGPANYMTIMKNLQGVLLADEARGYTLPKATRERYEREVERLSGLTPGVPANNANTRSVTLPDGRVVENVPANVTDEQVFQMMQGR